MKVTGIIAEYNPFHNGHLHQIETIRHTTDTDYIIVVMSGDYVQRGAPALIDKYTRAKMALSCGADMVLELPVVWSLASAEYFASAGVALLDKLGIVNTLCFGAESADSPQLITLAQYLAHEPESYRERLQQFLKDGNSFPKARELALTTLADEAVLTDDEDILSLQMDSDNIHALLSSPNNILGLEYCKAIIKRNSHIQPLAIQRIGEDYHATSLDSEYVSATGIRKYLSSNMDLFSDLTSLKMWMPPQAYTVLCESLRKRPLLFEEDFSTILGYELMRHTDFSGYADSSEELSNRIQNKKSDYMGIGDFIDTLKTKEVTYTRLCRLTFHILLDIKNQDYDAYRNLDYTPYGKILGFRTGCDDLLKAMKSHSSIPLVTTPSDKKGVLTPEANSLLEKDLMASEIYRLAAVSKSGMPVPNVYREPFLKL